MSLDLRVLLSNRSGGLIRTGYLTWVLLLFAPYGMVYGQDQGNNSYFHSRYLLERMATMKPSSNSIPGISAPKSSVNGNFFLKDNFALTTFLLSDGNRIGSYHSKYDIVRDAFYLITNIGLRVLHGSQVKIFYWIDSLNMHQENFISSKDFPMEDGIPPGGFFEILFEGTMPLLKKTEVVVLSPDFNIALNVGRKDFKVLKKEHLYTLVSDTLRILPTTRKLPSIFGAQTESMKEFIENNELDLNNEGHLIELFGYFNNLMETRE